MDEYAAYAKDITAYLPPDNAATCPAMHMQKLVWLKTYKLTSAGDGSLHA